MSYSPDAIIGAAYTLIGAAAGATMALVPMTIMGVMTRLADDQRTAQRLSDELAELKERMASILESSSPSTFVFPPIPKAAWAYALTRPSFILSLEKATFTNLSDIAAATGVLDDVLQHVRLVNASMSTSPSWGNQHQNARAGLDTMLKSAAKGLQDLLIEVDSEPGLLFAYRRDLESRLIEWRVVIFILVTLAIIAIGIGAILLHAASEGASHSVH